MYHVDPSHELKNPRLVFICSMQAVIERANGFQIEAHGFELLLGRLRTEGTPPELSLPLHAWLASACPTPLGALTVIAPCI